MINLGTTNLGQIEASISDAIQLLQGKRSDTEKKLFRAMNQIAEFVAERAVANAPILKSDLRAAMAVQEAHLEGDVIVSRVVNSTPYALKQHEELGPPSVNSSGWMKLGPISSIQPTTPEGGVGGKYIERSVQMNMDRIQAFLKKAFES